MMKFKRALVVAVLTTVAACGVFNAPAGAARQSGYWDLGSAVFFTTGKTVVLSHLTPVYYTAYLTQTGANGQQVVYSASVDNDGVYAPSSAEIDLRWSLCSHPALLVVVQHLVVGVDELGQPIFEDATFTDQAFDGGVIRDREGEFVRSVCPGRDKK